MNNEAIQLTQKERDYLVEVLKDRLGTQREGIYHSETAAFKDEMKQEEQTLRQLIDKLNHETASGYGHGFNTKAKQAS